jgi:spore maturation protein CgeB
VRVVIFCHSIRSDWDNGSAHFLRGVAHELQSRGHQVALYEPRDGWSATNLAREAGAPGLELYREVYPTLKPIVYTLDRLDLEYALAGAQLVIVHDWNTQALIGRLAQHRIRRGRYALLFYDTYHRSITHPEETSRLDLSGYDGVLAIGEVIRQQYLRAGWTGRVWTWHEAADTRVFFPRPEPEYYSRSDLAWFGNWGNEERTSELYEFLLNPVRRLSLRGHVYGVGYPRPALALVERCGLQFLGWIPNHRVARALCDHRLTVHIPRRVFAERLPGIPTIRVFEALACGTPLVCAPWEDTEQLFQPGRDYLVAPDGSRMATALRRVLADTAMAAALSKAGRSAIEARHTCAHRVEELLAIVRQLVEPVTIARGAARPPAA